MALTLAHRMLSVDSRMTRSVLTITGTPTQAMATEAHISRHIATDSFKVTIKVIASMVDTITEAIVVIGLVTFLVASLAVLKRAKLRRELRTSKDNWSRA